MEPFETIVSNLGFPIAIANWNSKVVGVLNSGNSLTYVAGPLSAKNGTTIMYRCKNDVYLTASSKYTRVIYV